MNCPKCHRDTYSKKWGTCTACNKERLTDAINVDEGLSTPGAAVQEAATPGDADDGLAHPGPTGGAEAASPRTPNRRSRESYNTYMKGYMRAYRECLAG